MKVQLTMMLAVIVCMSCSKEDDDNLSAPMYEGEITVKANTSELSEEIHNVTIWIYKRDPDINENEDAVSCAFSNSGASLRISMPSSGESYYRVACNLPQNILGDQPVSSELLTRNIDDMEFKCNSLPLNSFIMSGRGILRPKSDFGELSVMVRRRVAKISVEKITNTIITPWCNSSKISICGFYIENGVAFIDMDWSERQPVSCADFYNCSTIPPLQIKNPYLKTAQPWKLASNPFRNPVIINHGGSACFNPESYSVYACRNSVKTDHMWTQEQAKTGQDWPIRKTRLVIHCQIENADMFYAITLDCIEPGTWYRFSNINLRHAGSSDPDIPVEISDADFSLEINNWEQNPHYIENI